VQHGEGGLGGVSRADKGLDYSLVGSASARELPIADEGRRALNRATQRAAPSDVWSRAPLFGADSGSFALIYAGTMRILGAPLPLRRSVVAACAFLEPSGDPGMYGPDSVAWRVHANPVALAAGGVAAVILQLAEPRVRSGVWEHSGFRKDPIARMERTAEAAMITTYGATAAAEARIAMITRMHARVSGVTPDGEAYSALDPELLGWVHLTAGYGFLNAYRRYVDPQISPADQDRYYAEGARLGLAFGALDPPTSRTAVEKRIEAMRPKLQPHAILKEFLHIVSTNSPLGLAGLPLQPLLVRAAIDTLPPGVRGDIRLCERPLASAAVLAAMRALAAAAGVAPNGIVRQAYARVGRRPPP